MDKSESAKTQHRKIEEPERADIGIAIKVDERE
jgi:hypothetical protein